MPFAAAMSEHPETAHAIGEVTGQVLDGVGEEPDLALLFVTPSHAPAMEDAAAVVAAVLRPRTILGCAAVAVLANGREVEEGPGVTLWAGRFGPVAPARFGPGSGQLEDPPFTPSALVLLGDPYTFPAEELFAQVEARWPGLSVIGGMASAGRAPGDTLLLLDGDTVRAGAVGAFVGPGLEVEPVVSQGCRPIGQPLVVTAGEGTVVRELGGRRAIDRLLELAERDLSERDIALINGGGLHVGRVVDEHTVDPGRGDFLVRNVVGGNQREGWIAIGDSVEVGQTLQYHLRDADTADDDLRALLAARSADAALVFTCNGRGSRLFSEADHDAGVVADYLGRPPAAGFFAAGEFGPVGGRNFVHGFTASLALLREAPGGGR